MSVNGLSNARLAVASLVHGVSFLKRSRPDRDRDDPPPPLLPRLVHRLLALRRARRAHAAKSRDDSLSRTRAQRERFERLLAQITPQEETSRRSGWLHQSRLAMQELDEMISGRGPLPGDPPAAGKAPGAGPAGPAGGGDE